MMIITGSGLQAAFMMVISLCSARQGPDHDVDHRMQRVASRFQDRDQSMQRPARADHDGDRLPPRPVTFGIKDGGQGLNDDAIIPASSRCLNLA